MPLVPVYEEAVTRTYRAPPLSAAHVYANLSRILTVLVTLVLCFVSQGLWKKTNTYLEHPAVEVAKESIAVLSDGSGDPSAYYFWSSFNELNANQQETLILPAVESKVQYNESERTTKVDLDFTFWIPDKNGSHFRVRSIFYAVFFDFTLNQRALIRAKTCIIGQIERYSAGSGVRTTGDLRLSQRDALPSYGEFDWVHDFSQTVNQTSVAFDFADYFPAEIHQQTLQQPLTAEIASPYLQWYPVTDAANGTFSLSFRLLQRQQEFTYRTNAFELLKWAWLQFIGLFVIVKFVFDRLSAFLYLNRILGTIATSDKIKDS